MEKTFAKSIIRSLGKVVPLQIKSKSIHKVQLPVQLSEVNILIGTIGDIEGNVAIYGTEETFKKISETMYGMELEGEMLFSFAGEFGNILAGNTATILSEQKLKVDVSPPSILEGSSVLRSLEKNSQGITFLIDDQFELDLIISCK